ncbi:uncharacterized protein LOC144077047 isoform X1 [Stigmatopora argus]
MMGGRCLCAEASSGRRPAGSAARSPFQRSAAPDHHHPTYMCGVNWFPKGTLLRSWLTKSRPRLLLLIAGLKRPQVTLMRRKRMKRTKVAKATTCNRMPHFT